MTLEPFGKDLFGDDFAIDPAPAVAVDPDFEGPVGGQVIEHGRQAKIRTAADQRHHGFIVLNGQLGGFGQQELGGFPFVQDGAAAAADPEQGIARAGQLKIGIVFKRHDRRDGSEETGTAGVGHVNAEFTTVRGSDEAGG